VLGARNHPPSVARCRRTAEHGFPGGLTERLAEPCLHRPRVLVAHQVQASRQRTDRRSAPGQPADWINPPVHPQTPPGGHLLGGQHHPAIPSAAARRLRAPDRPDVSAHDPLVAVVNPTAAKVAARFGPRVPIVADRHSWCWACWPSPSRRTPSRRQSSPHQRSLIRSLIRLGSRGSADSHR
jgi:hypothetical protein